MNQLFDSPPDRPGYRLQRLELYNWGTFDSSHGQVYCFEPEGRTSLLVGHNGSGKSTLVDAITTLLGNNRNYNIAAGARRSERTPKSYIKGAYDRTAGESQVSVVRFLRPKANHLSAISGVFKDEELGKTFTLTQVLFLRTDGSDDKVYAIADSEHGLKGVLQGLLKSDQVAKHLRKITYKTTKTYNEYLGWIKKRTGMRGKAIDMFNQTVAVKDIQSLNDFIRKHMLESNNWNDRIKQLLSHFNDLSAAHQELVRAQQQIELLTPIQELGVEYHQRSEQFEQLNGDLEAAESFFPTQFVNIFEPEIETQKANVDSMGTTIERLDGELTTQQESIRQLKNEIDNAGGERLKALPALIENERLRLSTKKIQFEQFHELLQVCRIKGVVLSTKVLKQAHQHLRETLEKTDAKIQAASIEHEQAIGKRASVERELQEERSELAILQKRRTNLPPWCTAMRSQICSDLKLEESELPFAAELISVIPEESDWESSIEMVLRPFALNLLVPDRYYSRVHAYVERNKILDQRGQGAKLDYNRVGVEKEPSGDRVHESSLIHKIKFKSRHPLTPWVRGVVTRRFNYQCCHNDQEFASATSLALTANRHVKLNSQVHKKDDRQRTADPRYFVLGWDNTEKKKRITSRIEELETQQTELNQVVIHHGKTLSQLNEILRAAREALKVNDFDAIDAKRHEEEIKQLLQEKEDIEKNNKAVKTLKKRLKSAVTKQQKLNQNRDDLVGEKATISKQIKLFQCRVDEANALITKAKASGVYGIHAKRFDSITTSLGEPFLSFGNIESRQKRWESETRHQIKQLRNPLDELKEKLISVMSKFLRDFKDEQGELDANMKSLDSFIGRLDQLKQEDLPRHRVNFENRLNDQVTNEIALFNTQLNEEQKAIKRKIEKLNQALANVDYDQNRGTYMQLDPQPVKDGEIEQFRRSLRECMDESLETTPEANKARYDRIEALVQRLSDKERTTWRNRVIDVRNWYDFLALELERETETNRGSYDGSSGQSGGEKAKLAFTILVAALAYQFDVDPTGNTPGKFQFVVVDEMFSKVDDQNARYALQLFKQFGLQLLIVAPLDAKARITEPFVDRFLLVSKDAETNHSQLYSMTAREYDEVVKDFSGQVQPLMVKPNRSK